MLHSVHPGPHNVVPPPPPGTDTVMSTGPPTLSTEGDGVATLLTTADEDMSAGLVDALARYGPCVNLDLSGSVPGDLIARGARVSLTFRREILTT